MFTPNFGYGVAHIKSGIRMFPRHIRGVDREPGPTVFLVVTSQDHPRRFVTESIVKQVAHRADGDAGRSRTCTNLCRMTQSRRPRNSNRSWATDVRQRDVGVGIAEYCLV